MIWSTRSLSKRREGGREGGSCARTKEIGKTTKMKKFATLEQIVEQVSFFDYVFFIFTSITGTNLVPIRNTRLDPLTIK
jgi:hypothetical protein